MAFVSQALVLNHDLARQDPVPVSTALALIETGLAQRYRDNPFTIILDPESSGGSSSPGPSVQTDPWHVVGDPGEPDFLGGWDPITSEDPAISESFQGLRFRKVSGFVELQGLIKGGNIGDIFVLPEGYRPPALVHGVGRAFRGLCVFRIKITGEVLLQFYVADGENTNVSLGCIFGVDEPAANPATFEQT